MQVPFDLYYNVVEDSLYNLHPDPCLAEKFQALNTGPFLNKIFLRRSTNQGKDIGGKMVLFDSFLRAGADSEYILFLHDKKSPHKIQNQEWKDKLFQILEPPFAEKAFRLFRSNNEIGIIAPSHTINNEYDPALNSFASKNRTQLTELIGKYHLDVPDHRFVAGTMFWARSFPLVQFFRKHPPLDIRASLEKGNIMDETNGTNTHAWERLLCWLIFAQGYTIKELS